MHGPLNVILINEYFGMLTECLHETSVIVIVFSYHHYHHHLTVFFFPLFEWAQ
jgi:hypothetical protein